LYEQAPNGNAPEVRELWHVIDQLLDIGELRNYDHGTGVLAINLAEMMLAALRRGLPLPSKARISRLLSMSIAPLYRGRIRVAHDGRRIICMAFELV